MKKELKGFVAGVLMTSLLMTGSVAWAAGKTVSAELLYNNIKIYIDNVLTNAKDANGKTIEPFIYNGTTYLPVRGVAQALGVDVQWDGSTNSVYLWDEMVPGGTYLVEAIEAYEKSNRNFVYVAKQTEGKSFSMMGTKYSNGIYTSWGDGHICYNLNGKYSDMTFTFGHLDGYSAKDSSVTIVVDGEAVQTVDLAAEEAPRQVTVPLNKGLQLKIVMSDDVGLANITLD